VSSRRLEMTLTMDPTWDQELLATEHQAELLTTGGGTGGNNGSKPPTVTLYDDDDEEDEDLLWRLMNGPDAGGPK
jgi:hypothetical protein